MRNKQLFFGAVFFAIFLCRNLNAQSLYIGPVGPDFNIPYGPEICTGLFSAGNIYVTARNIKCYRKENDDPSNAGFYFISGVFQFSYGVFFLPDRQDLKAINEAAGGAAIITSIMRMVRPHKKKDALSLIPYVGPTKTGRATGFHLILSF